MTIEATGTALDAVRRVGVLGAGTMGSGIAQVVAEAGIEVDLHDPVEGAVARARERIAGFVRRKVEKGQLDDESAALAVARIGEVPSVEALVAADVVIEAIPEDLELKRGIFRRLDAAAPPRTILATNTSSLPVARIAGATVHPERVVGMHFFNPVPLMALVEVVAGAHERAAHGRRGSALRATAGKDPGGHRRHPGLHRQPGRAALLPRGAPHPGRRRGGGRGDRRRHARHRLPDGSIRAHRRHRCRRQPRRQRERSQPVLLRPTLPSAPHPAHARRRGPARPKDERRFLRLRDRWVPDRAVDDPRAAPGRSAARPPRRGADRRADPGGDRQRGRLRGGGGGRCAGRHRHRHAPRHQLPIRTAGMGRADRPGARGTDPGRPARPRAGRPLSDRSAAADARRAGGSFFEAF